MTLLVGHYLGNYYLQELIGYGEFTAVYRAEHMNLHREVAIKVVTAPLRDDVKEDALKEAKMIAQLDHPNIIKVTDCGIINGILFFVMSYASGGTLRAKMQQHSLAVALSYMKQVANALNYIHKRGIIHRDVKPENILLGGHDEVLLSDFNIALDTATEGKGTPRGTVLYVAPEQAHGIPCPASDQYALAVVLYEWLCGRCPFDEEDDHAILLAHHTQTPPSLCKLVPTISPQVESAIFRALKKNPEERYPDVMEFIRTLEQLQDTSGQSWEESVPPPNLDDSDRHTNNDRASTSSAQLLDKTILAGKKSTASTLPPIDSAYCAATLSIHTEAVNALAWSPDGQYLASGGNDKLCLYRLSIREYTELSYEERHLILSLAWSPSSQKLLFGCEDQVARMWDIASKKIVLTHREQSNDGYGLGLVYPLAWSHNEKMIVSASNDQPLHVWDATDGKTLCYYQLHRSDVNALSWSPNSQKVVSANSDKSIHVWDVCTGKNDCIYQGHKSCVLAVDWSSNGTMIASADAQGFIHVWDGTTGKVIYVYGAHLPRRVLALVWSPDGQAIASAGEDKKVRLWRPSNGECIAFYGGHASAIKALAWSHDGTLLASAGNDKIINIWHVYLR